MNNQFETERSSNRTLVVQAADRLQQIVELQTSLELQRQMARSDSERLHQLEEQVNKLSEENSQCHQRLQSAEKELQQWREKTKQLEAEMEHTHTEAVLQKNVVDALTTAVKERTAECTVGDERMSEKQEKDRRIDELIAQKASLEKRCQQLQEEEEKNKVVLESQALSVQALSKSLGEEREQNRQLQSEAAESKKREDFWRQEIATFRISLEQIESMLNRDRAEWQEALEVPGKGKKLDSIYQKNLSINQLKDENRRLIAKVVVRGAA